MGTFNYQDRTPVGGIVDEGNYIVQVIGFEEGLSKGDKTNGSPKYELKLSVEKSGTVLYEHLVDHEKTAWKIDQFLRASNFSANLKKGQDVEISAETVLGLRAWAKLTIDKKDPQWPRNKVSVWLTDKPKLERAKQEDPEDEFEE